VRDELTSYTVESSLAAPYFFSKLGAIEDTFYEADLWNYCYF